MTKISATACTKKGTASPPVWCLGFLDLPFYLSLIERCSLLPALYSDLHFPSRKNTSRCRFILQRLRSLPVQLSEYSVTWGPPIYKSNLHYLL